MKLQLHELHHGKPHHKGKKSHKIMKKMAKLEKKLGKYNLDANQSDSSSSSSSSSSSADDSRHHRRSRGRTDRSRSRGHSRSRGKRHGHQHKHGKRSSSSSSSDSSSSSSSPGSPSPHRRHPHHHGPAPHLMGRSRSFGARPSGPPFPWGRHHHRHPFEQPHPHGPFHGPAHGPPHHRSPFGRHHRHHQRGMPGWFAFMSQRGEVPPTNGCCGEAQPDLVDLSANGEGEAAGTSNVEEMDEDVNVQEPEQEVEEEEEPERGPEINENLAKNWTEIIDKGLPNDKRTTLIRKYPVSVNCLLLQAPKINKEILAVAPVSVIERDSVRMQEQNQIGAGLAALGLAMSDLEHKIAKDKDLAAVYDTLNEAAEVIVDAHHKITQTRQAFISSELHRRVRPLVENCKPDCLLYGKDFGEKVKNVKGFRKARKAQRPECQCQKGGKCKGDGDKRKSKRFEGKGGCRRGPEQQ